jgi:uncharacterized repeat protein (TIGR01451 family)
MLLQISPGRAAGSVVSSPVCDLEQFIKLEADFQHTVRLQAEYPGIISKADYKAAALNYILNADQCYQAALSASAIPAADPLNQDPVVIDHGGEWAPGSAPSGDERFVTFGRKWGANSPFAGGSNQAGPGTPGGLVTYSFMNNQVSHNVEELGNNVDIRTSLGVNHCIESDIALAFAAWSAIANIQFVQVPDNGTASDGLGAVGDIRIGAHPFDGQNGVLAHAFFPPPNGISLSGDMHFDSAEAWSCQPGSDVFDIGFVALHEIGHALGLSHQPAGGQIAVMNPSYNPNLTTLQPDDINGAVSIYGNGRPLTLAKTLETPPSAVTSSAVVTFKLKIQNLSAQSVTNVILRDTLPAGSHYIPGSVKAAPAILNLNGFPDNLPTFAINGHSSLELTYKVQLGPAKKGQRFTTTATLQAPGWPQPVQANHTLIVDPYLTHLPLLYQ